MSTLKYDGATASGQSGGWIDGVVRLMSGASRTVAAREGRAATLQLLALDDRMLNDIGVSRSDVENALSVPQDQDPSSELARIRRLRMQADRQGLLKRHAL